MLKIIILDILMFTPIFIPVALKVSHRSRDITSRVGAFFSRPAKPATTHEPAFGTPALAYAD